jgi:SAM-dependent methyltransferase
LTTPNYDPRTLEGFGDEWTRLDQSEADPAELRRLFSQYFAVFPWERLPPDAEGFDLGCGSGRWARLASPRVGRLHCIDASAPALSVARKALAGRDNCELHLASVDALPLADASQDFGYSLGVLHHVPDTAAAIASCAAKLKPGAPLLLYLYYAFDNRPFWFRAAWRMSEPIRRGVSALPSLPRYLLSQALAFLVYLPLARVWRLLERAGLRVEGLPLSAYRDRTFYAMRTDALDRFGTRLEKRFTREEIRRMMEAAGLEDVRFGEGVPYWCAVGFKKP